MVGISRTLKQRETIARDRLARRRIRIKAELASKRRRARQRLK